MIKRWWNMRATRKFRQNRLAVLALIVITSYITLALVLMMGGFISLETSEQRIGSNELPGMFILPEAEDRMEAALDRLDAVDRALKA